LQRRRFGRALCAAPGLLDAPMSATHAPVVLVSAPAGYGKTTLLALWREHDERPFAWVTLDAADNDPVALAASVLACARCASRSASRPCR
jgi:LuxR family maltose regulon positive regulatory protein